MLSEGSGRRWGQLGVSLSTGSQVLNGTTLWVRSVSYCSGSVSASCFFIHVLILAEHWPLCEWMLVCWLECSIRVHFLKKGGKGKRKYKLQKARLKTLSIIHLFLIICQILLIWKHCHETVESNEKNLLCFQIAACEWCENIFCDKCSYFLPIILIFLKISAHDNILLFFKIIYWVKFPLAIHLFTLRIPDFENSFPFFCLHCCCF